MVDVPQGANLGVREALGTEQRPSRMAGGRYALGPPATRDLVKGHMVRHGEIADRIEQSAIV